MRFALLAFLVLAAFAVHRDLMQLSLFQGASRLLAGDVHGAEAALQRAHTLGAHSPALAYNLGVSHYRRGEYAQARRQFTAALAATELAAASHYNLGNCRFREAEQLATSDPRAATALFQEAIGAYTEALALAPGARDAGANLNLARARHGTLMASTGREAKSRPQPPAAPPQADAGQRGRAAAPGQAAPSQTAAGRSADPGAETPAQGKARRNLSRSEALRMLNEARGRELPAGPAHAGRHTGALAGAERDW